MPHRVDRWNFTDRGSATCHNDTFRGKGNATYTVPVAATYQGFASVIATFPQGSFATCRYPVLPEQQRTPQENTWHPSFVQVPSGRDRYAESAAAAAGNAPQLQEAKQHLQHNITGTNPLPIPFSQRAGYEEEEAAKKAAQRAAYLAFRAHQISSVGGDKIPADFHEHTVHSSEHIRTQLRPGQVFRPSKPRVGTTPLERAHAALSMQRAQEATAEAGRDEERIIRDVERRAAMRNQAAAQGMMQYQQGEYTTVTSDPRRQAPGQPSHYNVPTRQLHPSQYQ